MRLVLAGTPDVACVCLDRLIDSPHEVVAVITRPPARRGRGRSVAPSPVAERAAELGLPVLSPSSLRDPSVKSDLEGLHPDCCPIVAYGGLVPPELLDVPVHGWVNLHFSLLPAWRGAAPVQHALKHGDEVTGASTFRLTEGLDTGPVYGTVTEAIGPTDTAGDVLARLAVSGAELLVHTLDGIDSGVLIPVEQSRDGVSVAPKLTSADAKVSWGEPALAVDRRIRACTPEPGAWTEHRGSRLGLLPIVPAGRERAEQGTETLGPGVVRVTKRSVFVGSGSEPVELGEVRPEGRRAMPAADWARGVRLVDGEQLQ